MYFPGKMMSGAYVSSFLPRKEGVPENELEGVVYATNKDSKFLPWNFDETLGSTYDECTSTIRLHEIDKLNGTPAAEALVGKSVPVNLVVEYNSYPLFSKKFNFFRKSFSLVVLPTNFFVLSQHIVVV